MLSMVTPLHASPEARLQDIEELIQEKFGDIPMATRYGIPQECAEDHVSMTGALEKEMGEADLKCP